MSNRYVISGLLVAATMGFGHMATAECSRTCDAKLEASVRYKERGTQKVRVSPNGAIGPRETARGSYGKKCRPRNIHRAKERACTAAVERLKARYSTPQAQMRAICQGQGSRVKQKCKAGFMKSCTKFVDVVPTNAAWYKIESMKAYGKRDGASRSRTISPTILTFRCDGKKPVVIRGGTGIKSAK